MHEDVTLILSDLSAGDRDALDRILPVLYEDLRALASRELRRERPDHTLNATALVHESYLKLVQLDRMSWQSRAHFFGAAAGVMRRLLIDHARRRTAGKRGGGDEPLSLDDVVAAAAEAPTALLALDEALARLESLNERQARVVECRFFAGMGVEETAESLGISSATVKRDWTVARAWLNRELTRE
ncbi:MAG TPA: ECF-type sigma factor [Longimicrobiales bacterium]|nr:ECF-type sigma factor [Longimicrobiales bacterium]